MILKIRTAPYGLSGHRSHSMTGKLHWTMLKLFRPEAVIDLPKPCPSVKELSHRDDSVVHTIRSSDSDVTVGELAAHRDRAGRKLQNKPTICFVSIR